MENISKKIAKFICHTNGVTDIEKQAVVAYGLEVTLATLISVFVVVLIGVIVNRTVETIIFVCIFMLLRTFTGGYHAKNHLNCFFILLCVFFIQLILNNQDVIYFMTPSWITILFAIIVIATFAPVEDENYPLSTKQKKKNKLVCVYIIFVLLLLAFVFTINKLNALLFNLAYGMIVTALSILAVKIKNNYGGDKNEKV